MVSNCGAREDLRVPWTARRSNQSILKEINPEYSLEGLMLKLKLQYFGHLMQRANSLEKTLMLEKIEGKRRRGQQRMRWLGGITNSTDMTLSKLQEILKNRGACHAAAHGVSESQTRCSNWATIYPFVHVCVYMCVFRSRSQVQIHRYTKKALNKCIRVCESPCPNPAELSYHLGAVGFLTPSWREKNCVLFLVLRFVESSSKVSLRKQTVYLTQHINTHYTFWNGLLSFVLGLC